MIMSFDRILPLSLLPPRSGDNNVDLDHLLKFATQLYHPHMDDSFYIQLYVCAALTAIMLPVTILMLLNRIRLGRAWFLKIWPVAGGTFVIPNAVVAFLICEGGFAIFWVAYVFVSVAYYRDRGLQKYYFLWKSLVWVPLWMGGWWTGFGFLSAFPDALTHKSKGGMQRRLILSPFCFNAICWFVPLLLLASLLPPAILAAKTYNATLDDYRAWRAVADAERQSAISDATFSALRAQALLLWLDVTKAYWYFGICMTCWCVWAAICLIVYLPVGGHTLWRIREQLLVAKSKYRSLDRQTLPTRIVVTGCKICAAHAESQVNPHVLPSHMANSDSASPQALDTALHGVACKDHDGQLDTQHRDAGFSSQVFPPTQIHSQATDSRAATPRTVEQRRTDNLERVYRNLSVQYYGICVSIVCFLNSASIYAVDSYDCARINRIAVTQVRGNLSAAYVIVCFGWLTVIAIFWRSLDPSLSIDFSEEASSPVASRCVFVTLFKSNLKLCPWVRTSEAGGVDADGDGAACRFPSSMSRQPCSNGFRSTQSSHTHVDGSIVPHPESRKLDRQDSEPKMVHERTASASINSKGSPSSTNPSKEVIPEGSAVVLYVTPFEPLPATGNSLAQKAPEVIELRSFSSALDSNTKDEDASEELVAPHNRSKPLKCQGSSHMVSVSSLCQ